MSSAERRAPRRAADRSAPASLEATFEPRLNGLNLLRLALALGVVLRHSYTMLGEPTGWQPAEVLMRSVFVDGFFAISGFLIVRSWVTKPDAYVFLRARLLRIMPGFWVCLVVVAFVFAPLHALITGVTPTAAFFGDAGGYVLRNAGLWIFQDGIAGGPLGASPAEAGTWNGSLWTLFWEFVCYLGVLVLGVSGLLRRRWVLPAAFVAAVAVLSLTAVPALDVWFIHHAARFATMFLAGALVYQYRDRIPARGRLVAVAVVVVVATSYLPDYRMLGALPLAYACIVGGAMIKVPALTLRTDLSYGTYIYAYPVQQLLVGAGLGAAGVPLYFVLCVLVTLPLAAASWFVVERPALRHKLVRRPATPAASAPVPSSVQEEAVLVASGTGPTGTTPDPNPVPSRPEESA
jgi:peptidoglycan/LPS O-acetylase OafA/YrhL